VHLVDVEDGEGARQGRRVVRHGEPARAGSGEGRGWSREEERDEASAGGHRLTSLPALCVDGSELGRCTRIYHIPQAQRASIQRLWASADGLAVLVGGRRAPRGGRFRLEAARCDQIPPSHSPTILQRASAPYRTLAHRLAQVRPLSPLLLLPLICPTSRLAIDPDLVVARRLSPHAAYSPVDHPRHPRRAAPHPRPPRHSPFLPLLVPSDLSLAPRLLHPPLAVPPRQPRLLGHHVDRHPVPAGRRPPLDRRRPLALRPHDPHRPRAPHLYRHGRDHLHHLQGPPAPDPPRRRAPRARRRRPRVDPGQDRELAPGQAPARPRQEGARRDLVRGRRGPRRHSQGRPPVEGHARRSVSLSRSLSLTRSALRPTSCAAH